MNIFCLMNIFELVLLKLISFVICLVCNWMLAVGDIPNNLISVLVTFLGMSIVALLIAK